MTQIIDWEPLRELHESANRMREVCKMEKVSDGIKRRYEMISYLTDDLAFLLADMSFVPEGDDEKLKWEYDKFMRKWRME